MHIRAQKARLAAVFFSYLFIIGVIFLRLLDIQLLNNNSFVKLADAQHQTSITLYPQRGMIYDRNEKILALSLKMFSVYAVPQTIKDKEKTAQVLSEILDIDEQSLMARLSRKKSFVWVKRRIDEKTIKCITGLNLAGVGYRREYKRYYPNGELAAHVLGFSGMDDRGLEGGELYYDRYLKGQLGRRSILRDAKQRILPAFEYELIPVVDGYNLVLTVDEVIQHIVEEELKNAFAKSNAKAASVVVMNPYTGEIYALANLPSYNLNFYQETDTELRRNRAITDFFEPGSTFKIITASAALNENIVKPNDTFFCENGEYRIANHTLHDHKPHGELTFIEIIEKSSNIGVAKIAQKMGGRILQKHIELFAFGEKTRIDLPGETAGMVRNLEDWSKTSIGAIPMGQEIAVSVLQMTRAMAVIANGGNLVQPHILRKIMDVNGELIQEFSCKNSSRIISRRTASIMKQILKRVVASGTGKQAKINGYETAGKTGTAQKVEPNGIYSHSKFIASFVGFAPVKKPRVVVMVVMDEPRPVYYGGVVCAPVFKNITERILKYLNVPKSDERVARQVK